MSYSFINLFSNVMIRYYRIMILAAAMVMISGLIPVLTIYADGPVVDTAVDENDGSCADDCSLRDAIFTANGGDTITFVSDFNIFLDTELNINKTVTIDSDGQNITVSGDSGNDDSRNVRVFYIGYSGVVTLTNLNIVSGTATSGGGIYNYNGTLTINNSTISDNHASGGSPFIGGGGIYNLGTVTLNNSIISDNQAGYGGGIDNSSEGILTFNDSTLSNNEATYYGGGIYNGSQYDFFEDSMLIISNSTVSNNQAGYGGGIYNYNKGVVTINNGTILGNQAFNAGGINNVLGTVAINNGTLSNNQASSYGGGIYNYNRGVVTITNSTLSNNQGGYGGGIYNSDFISSTTLYLRNTIIANNTGGDCRNDSTIATNTNNLIEDNSCSPDLSGDPNLGPLQDNGGSTFTHALLEGSLAIDAGSCSSITTDQRGFSRPVDIATIPNTDDGCDIGAYEFGASQSPSTTSIFLPIILK